MGLGLGIRIGWFGRGGDSGGGREKSGGAASEYKGREGGEGGERQTQRDL